MMTLYYQYPDTEEGARAALKGLADKETWERYSKARFHPDPSVEGVWAADTANGERAIIYLCGYRTPFGSIRRSNDFEEGTIR